MKSRRILYWALQVCSWGAYFGYYAVIISLFAHNRPALRLIPVLAVFHLAASHGIRAVIRRGHWLALPAGRLAARWFAVSLLFAIALQIAFTPIAAVFGAATWREQIANDWMYACYSFVLFFMWTAFYLAFEHVFRSRESEFKRLRLEASLREAELRALKQQVNPHFMFNCLNNLRSLVAEDGERGREMLLRLSELLRYALDAGRHERVHLRDELRVVAAYLELEKLQFEDRLTWFFDVDQDALEATTPPMLLQQLVENAVKHGISLNPAGGEIGIRARVIAGMLDLNVENTGQLKSSSGNGVGLANARDRLRLLCGASAMLSVSNRDATHVVARAQIPFAAV